MAASDHDGARDEPLVERILEAQADERERIARELHDETGQRLTALLVGLRTLEEMASAEIRTQVQELRDGVRTLIDNVRRLSRGLHPTALDELGLSEVLDQQVAEFREMSGIDAALDVQDPEAMGELGRPAALAVYRIVQEGLTNVWRHAEANRVEVRVVRAGEAIRVDVADDGNGLAHRKPEHRGLGLRLMQRRAESLGGSLTVEAVPGEGTTLRVELPLLRAER